MLTGYDALSTYSVPLEIAVESGILGLIAFFSFIILFLIKSIKFLIAPNQNELSTKAVIIAGILVIMGVMTHGLFDTIFFRPQVQFLFWTMIAMVSATFINKKQENN
jgi:putative inorganic carbon (HCO3(-)) transporter